MIKQRGYGNNLIIELTQENINKLKKEGESKKPGKEVVKGIPIFKGEALEKEAAAKEAVYKVVALSKSLEAQGDISVGEYVGIKNNTPIEAVDIDGVEYGIIPAHSILYISA